MGRHDVGQVTMTAMASNPIAVAAAAPASASQGAIANGTYVIQTPSGGGTEAYRAASLNATSVAHLADGTSVYVRGSTQNQFALAQFQTPTGYASGWVAIPMLVAQAAPPAPGPTMPGGPNAGANAPRVTDTPGQPPPAAPTPSKLPWLAIAGAAALGWFILVEQKKGKKGRSRR